MYRYEELKHLAIQAGVPDNKVSIGIWLKLNGWKKIRKNIDKKITYFYIKEKL